LEAFIIKALQLVLALTLLVVIHEFGHYIFARMFGIRVEKFYMFFNPWFSILKYNPATGRLEIGTWSTKDKTDKEKEVEHSLLSIRVGRDREASGGKIVAWRKTIYGIGWLPLGGYVKIAGMIDESMDKEQMAAEPKPWEFRTKPAWQRLLVMLAGVIFNFVLAIVIYAGIAFYWGEKVVPLQEATEGMNYSQPLQDVGLRNGDILLSLNGEEIDVAKGSVEWDLVQDGATIEVLRDHTDRLSFTLPDGTTSKIIKDNTLPVEYRFPVLVSDVVAEPAKSAGLMVGDRIVKIGTDTTPAFTEMATALEKYAGKPTTITVMRADSLVALKATPTAAGKLGFLYRHPADIYPTVIKEYGLFASVPRGVELGVNQLGMYVSSLKHVFTKSGAEQVGGFGAIGNMFPDKWNWLSFWNITAFLSVILAFMNVLPIPALDGGHVLFTLYEIVTRRKPSDKFLEYAQMAGMAFLLLLLVYANGNDLYRWIFK